MRCPRLGSPPSSHHILSLTQPQTAYLALRSEVKNHGRPGSTTRTQTRVLSPRLTWAHALTQPAFAVPTGATGAEPGADGGGAAGAD